MQTSGILQKNIYVFLCNLSFNVGEDEVLVASSSLLFKLHEQFYNPRFIMGINATNST